MIFSSLDFLFFIVAVLSLLILVRSQIIRRYIILFSSYFFYAYWDYRFLALLIYSTIFDYIIGKNIGKSTDDKQRKKILFFSIVMNLGLLGFFKYFNFFIASANSAFGGLNLNLSTLNIILPIGISFYTFQTMSYAIDVYRKKIQPADSFLDFAVFVAFFPQLVAGPIVRAADFLPQLKKEIIIRWVNIERGLQIFLFGLIKKVLIADRISYFVDIVFEGPGIYSTPTVWLALIGYSIQIYCDFSGYSDMAIGVARVLGFDLRKNFDIPYVSKSITEFWQRWHISLSSWFQDYVFTPMYFKISNYELLKKLNPQKRHLFSFVSSIMLGEALLGLWHGANWTFVVFGLWHGIWMIIYNLTRKPWGKLPALTRIVMTYLIVIFGFVFFRTSSLTNSFVYFNRMFSFESGISWIYSPMLMIVPLIVLAHFFAKRNNLKDYIIFDLSSFKGAFVVIFVIMSLFFLRMSYVNPFIYFQF